MPTKKQLELIATIAGAILLETPPTKNKWAVSAKVPWVTLRRLEHALTAAGYDMAAARARYDRLGEQRKPRTAKAA